jgi:hypothetical protein
MDAVFEAFKDADFRNTYVLIGVGLMILPMVGLAWWYHTNIGKTPGGRALMKRQNAVGAPIVRSPMLAQKNLAEAAKMARDLADGKYGDGARTMQTKVYWISGLWAVALCLYFGLLIWADEVNRVVPAP